MGRKGIHSRECRVLCHTVTSKLASKQVKKAYNMAKLMNIPVLGFIENMSYALCPDCGKKIEIFGTSKADEISQELMIPLIAKIPMDPVTANLVDKGAVELANTDFLDKAAELLERMN